MDKENMLLLLVGDGDETQNWLRHWAVSYPTVRCVECTEKQGIMQWQQQLNAVFDVCDNPIFIAATGAGAAAVAAWHYQAGVARQRRLTGIILASPPYRVYAQTENAVLYDCRFSCKTAWVVGENDEDAPQEWAKSTAERCRARFFIAPHKGSLRRKRDAWQWGMQLMQEMQAA